MSKKAIQSLVFFGVGQTSLEALEILSEQFEIEAVITKPDATDRNGKPLPTSVASWARKHAISVFKPAYKLQLSKLVSEKQFRSSVSVVLDYGVIIPQDVIDYFKFGIINSHFSLLPKYRGADPIRSAILNANTTTGVTIMKIVAELDAGPILSWAETKLDDSIDATELREQLSAINCGLLPETLKLYLAGSIQPIAQDNESASFTSKAKKEDGLLDPNKTASELANEVRAYVGWPKSYFIWQDNTIVITKAKTSQVKTKVGNLEVVDKKLFFGCQDGSLEVLELQPAGKTKMNSVAFINGYKTQLQ